MLGRLAYYGIGIPAAELIARLWAGRNPKIRSALHGNRIPRPRSGDDNAMNLWFHVSSLGEFEQARPVIEAVRARHSEAASWVSFFSPSGLEHARGYPHAADLFYVPFRRRHLQQAFDIIRPDAVVVIRFDLWPGLAWEAAARAVPLLLVNATLRAGSPRNHPLLGPPQRVFYRHVARVLAATEGDATRLRRLCGPGVPVEVSGDSRYDRVWQRSTAAISLGSLDTVLGTAARPVLVVGSSYEPEERVLAEALAVLGGPSASMSVVVVPHEPTEERLRFAERLFTEAGWSPRRLSAITPGEPWRMLLLDRVGVLAECYRHADWVMVGGSFRGKVHNVMEPAAWAKPITVGPHFSNSPEAVGMVESGAISAVSSAPGLAAVLGAWMSDPVRAGAQGSAARDFLTARLGASERIADAIDAAIQAGPRGIEELNSAAAARHAPE